MKIIQFINTLLGRINKDQILVDVRTTKDEIVKIVIPTYSHAAEFFRGNKLISDEATELQRLFYSKFERGGSAKQSSFIADIDRRLPDFQANVSFLEDQIEKHFERDVISDGMSARKANLLRAAEHVSFISRMTIDILNYVYSFEGAASGQAAKLAETESLISPKEAKHVERNITTYAMLLSDYMKPAKDFTDLFSDIPDISLNKNTAEAVSAVFDERKVDPFSAPFVSGFTGNPIYHIRLAVAEWQAARYRANENKKRMLELRLLHLQLLKDKKNDPKIEQEIEYTRNRISKIEEYLREVEESVDIGA